MLTVVADGSCCVCPEGLALEAPGLERQMLPCGHVLHESCIMEMRRWGASGRCQLCREACDDLTPVQVLVDHAVAFHARGSFAEAARVASEALDVGGRRGEGGKWRLDEGGRCEGEKMERKGGRTISPGGEVGGEVGVVEK